jgi:hypothetical protein
VPLFVCILLCMTDRRSGPPLFDLMRERGEDQDGPNSQPNPLPNPSQSGSNPTANPVPPPASQAAPSSTSSQTTQQSSAHAQGAQSMQSAWDTSGGVSRAERSAAAMLDDDVQSESGILLSMPKFYTIVAVIFGLLLVVWVVGYKLGVSDGKAEMTPFVRDQPVVRPQNDPSTNPSLNNPSRSTNNASQPDSSGGTETRSGVVNPSNTPQNSSNAQSIGSIMTLTGFTSQDPRQVGFNYLVLATLEESQAAEAIAYMSSNGVNLIGIRQVDSGNSSANNPPRYTLYSLGLAIPGNRWSAMSSDRARHQQLVADLGTRWQREFRGGSDFTRTNWEKYDP